MTYTSSRHFSGNGGPTIQRHSRGYGNLIRLKMFYRYPWVKPEDGVLGDIGWHALEIQNLK